MTRLMRAVIIMTLTVGVASLHNITILLMITKLNNLVNDNKALVSDR